ncbi:hypothetical protein MCAMS1_01602 [biofilm metagenome]
MHKPIYLKFLFYLSVFGLVVSVLASFYDVIFGYLFEFCHLIFEVIEMALDKFIEHTFNTDSRETELIVFYLMMIFIGFFIYFVWKALVIITASATHGLSQDWLLLKGVASSDWEDMTITRKIIWVCVFLLVNYLVSFLFF